MTYRRRWPASLQETAKAAGAGLLCAVETGLSVEASLAEQEQAVEVGNAEWERQCSLLKAYEHALTADSGHDDVGLRRADELFHIGLLLSKDPQRVTARKLRRRRDLEEVATRAAGETLASALALYWRAHGVDPKTVQDSKGTRERDRYWREWLAHLDGDYVLTKRDPKAIDSIHQAFDDWQDEMQSRAVTSSTVARARSAVIAVIRWLSQEYRLGWHIELKKLPAQKRTAKQTLSVEEQRRLLQLIADQPSETTAMIAVMLAGGVMASEIKRMDPETTTVALMSTYPHVVVGAGDVAVKIEARRRFVPIVWGTEVLEVVRTHLPQAIRSLENTADPTARVNKWLRTRGFTGINCHRLRDTMASVATAAMALVMSLPSYCVR